MDIENEPDLQNPIQTLMFRQIVGRAEGNFKKDGGLSPVLFLGQGHEIGIIPIEKQHVSQQCELLKKVSRRVGADFSILLSEAWTLSERARNRLSQASFKAIVRSGISKHPDRQTCLCASVEDSRRTWTGFAILKGRKLGTMKFTEITEDMHAEGRMLGFIHKVTDTPSIPLVDEPPLTGTFHQRLTQALNRAGYAPLHHKQVNTADLDQRRN